MAFTLEPIGIAHTAYASKASAPRQAPLADAPASIELFCQSGVEHAVEDLCAWSHIWVLFWFDRATHWRPKVLPPRSEVRRGVFATRAPHRPNPIGLSAVRLLGVEGLVLHVSGLDLLDGTPVLDIKPYVPYCDQIPTANSGWLDSELPRDGSAGGDLAGGILAGGDATGGATLKGPTARHGGGWQVAFSHRAEAQLALLERFGVSLREQLSTLLNTGPSPRPYRRIRVESGHSRIALGPWRARFNVLDAAALRLCVESLATGFREAQLSAAEPEHAAHLALIAAFGFPGH